MLISLILSLTYLKNNRIILLSLFVIVMPFIFRITDFVVTPKYRLSGTFKSFEQLFLIAAFIPFQCFFMIDAIFITIYRLCISRKHLLEWKSSDNLENLYKNSFKSYLKRMWISPVIALLVLYLSCFTNPVIFIYNRRTAVSRRSRVRSGRILPDLGTERSVREIHRCRHLRRKFSVV